MKKTFAFVNFITGFVMGSIMFTFCIFSMFRNFVYNNINLLTSDEVLILILLFTVVLPVSIFLLFSSIKYIRNLRFLK